MLHKKDIRPNWLEVGIEMEGVNEREKAIKDRRRLLTPSNHNRLQATMTPSFQPSSLLGAYRPFSRRCGHGLRLPWKSSLFPWQGCPALRRPRASPAACSLQASRYPASSARVGPSRTPCPFPETPPRPPQR